MSVKTYAGCLPSSGTDDQTQECEIPQHAQESDISLLIACIFLSPITFYLCLISDAVRLDCLDLVSTLSVCI